MIPIALLVIYQLFFLQYVSYLEKMTTDSLVQKTFGVLAFLLISGIIIASINHLMKM